MVHIIRSYRMAEASAIWLCVCVLHIKPRFPLVDIQHPACPVSALIHPRERLYKLCGNGDLSQKGWNTPGNRKAFSMIPSIINRRLRETPAEVALKKTGLEPKTGTPGPLGVKNGYNLESIQKQAPGAITLLIGQKHIVPVHWPISEGQCPTGTLASRVKTRPRSHDW